MNSSSTSNKKESNEQLPQENKLEDVRLEIEKIKIQIEEYNKESKKGDN